MRWCCLMEMRKSDSFVLTPTKLWGTYLFDAWILWWWSFSYSSRNLWLLLRIVSNWNFIFKITSYFDVLVFCLLFRYSNIEFEWLTSMKLHFCEENGSGMIFWTQSYSIYSYVIISYMLEWIVFVRWQLSGFYTLKPMQCHVYEFLDLDIEHN